MTVCLPLILPLYRRLQLYAELVALPHTIFALPFALSALILASGPVPPPLATVGWVILAMVGGRTYAMGLNRLLDATIDAKNPRTQGRVLPAGRLPAIEAWLLTLAALALLVFATWQLPRLCLQLLPLAVVVLTLYSYTKRFTRLCHLVLGMALGFGAVGGWIALTGVLMWQPVVLGLAVMLWVAGFDIIYACQDVDFDKSHRLHSLPAAIGIERALKISKVCHVATVLGMAVLAASMKLSTGLWPATLLMGGFLYYEHRLVSAENLDKVDAAFFTTNGLISLGVLGCVLFGHLVRWDFNGSLPFIPEWGLVNSAALVQGWH